MVSVTQDEPPVGPTQPPFPSQGRWCSEHGRYECVRSRSKGRGTCHSPRVTGLDACRMHAGVSGSVAKAKGQAVTAWAAMNAEGTPLGSLDPGRAVLGVLHMSWLRLHVYAGLLEQQVERDGLDGGIGTEIPEDDGALGEGGPSGLIGHTYGAVKDIGIYASGESVRALAQLEATERERVVRFAKVAHDMGIAEREVRLAESQGAMLAGVIRGVLDAMFSALVEALGSYDAAVDVLRGQWPVLVGQIVPAQMRAVLVEGAMS